MREKLWAWAREAVADPWDHQVGLWLVLRGLGLVAALAFGSLALQLEGLIGAQGIQPAADLLETVRTRHEAGLIEGVPWLLLPSVFWLGASDAALQAGAWAGVLAGLGLVAGVWPRLMLAVIWALYLSFFSVSGVFLGYQWDLLLLEAVAMAFLAAPAGARPRRDARPGSWPGLLALQLLVAKLMLMSGAVKLLSGDVTWIELRALDYHFWTQPLPNVLGWWAASLPAWALTVGVAVTLVVELALPVGVVLGRWGRRAAALGFIGLMVLIGATGSFGFFNLLTIVLCLALVDDEAWRRILPRRLWRALAVGGDIDAAPGRATRLGRSALWMVAALWLVWSGAHLGTMVGWWSPGEAAGQWMQQGARLGTVNRYGLFAVMTTERPEIVLEASLDGERWERYDFPFKPDRLDDAPRQAAPHQPRLDWQMWFAALGTCRHNPWLLDLQQRLLEGSEPVEALFEQLPLQGQRPRMLRTRISSWTPTTGAALEQTGRWWEAQEWRPYCPAVALDESGALRAVGQP